MGGVGGWVGRWVGVVGGWVGGQVLRALAPAPRDKRPRHNSPTRPPPPPTPPQARNPTLVTCSQMALAKPAFAELLLPAAFADLARGGGSATLAARVGAAVERHFLPAAHRHPKAMRALLTCLNALRGQRLDAMAAQQHHHHHQQQQQHPGGTTGNTCGTTGGTDARAWRQVYWLEVGYMPLAAAAVRCGAHFTALLYLEAHCEAAAGRLRLPPPGSREGAPLERLLLEVYSSINEPDGIYAVARSHSLLSQVGGWGVCVGV